MKDQPPKIRRREFIANLLFAGTALSVVSLQDQLGPIAQRIEEGWELPEEIEDRLKRNPPLNPQPKPTKTPPPPKPRPHPKGKYSPPLPGAPRMPPPRKSPKSP